MKQYMVEFREGTGWLCDTYEEALLTACEFILEACAVKLGVDGGGAEILLRQIASGSLEDAVENYSGVTIISVEKLQPASMIASLKAKAEALLHPPEPLPSMSLDSAISHARHRAECAMDPKCKQDHTQLADWLEDLKDLRSTGIVPAELLRGHYDE